MDLVELDRTLLVTAGFFGWILVLAVPFLGRREWRLMLGLLTLAAVSGLTAYLLGHSDDLLDPEVRTRLIEQLATDGRDRALLLGPWLLLAIAVLVGIIALRRFTSGRRAVRGTGSGLDDGPG